MPYNTVVTFTAGNTLAAADLNNNFANLDYLNAKINSQIQIGAVSLISGYSTTSPGEYVSTTNKVSIPVMDFPDSGAYAVADGFFVLPSDYNGGTMTAKLYWTADSTSTNSVVWGVQFRAFGDGDSIDQAYGTAGEVTDANKSTAYQISITAATSAITIAGTPSAGEMAMMRVYRNSADASDTLAATARLISVVLTYTRS